MSDPHVVVVTGVADMWGAEVARQLVGHADLHVIGVDARRSDLIPEGLDFIQADVRNPLLVELLSSENVDTVCHLQISESMKPSEAGFDLNLMGSLKVLGACVEAGVRRIVLKSSTMVYGARSTNPAYLTENSPLRSTRKSGYIRDLSEIEAFCNGFRRQHPELSLTILRFANIIGPNVRSPITRFLTDPYAPMLLGFDPMLQFVHESDVTAALVHAIRQERPGVYNIAAEGIVPLLKAMAVCGKIPIPVIHLLAYWGMSAAGNVVAKHMPYEPDYLRYRWVGDLEKMRTEFEFTPAYTAEEALREFAGEMRKRPFLQAERPLEYDEVRLRDTLERRRRSRAASDSKESAERDIAAIERLPRKKRQPAPKTTTTADGQE